MIPGHVVQTIGGIVLVVIAGRMAHVATDWKRPDWNFAAAYITLAGGFLLLLIGMWMATYWPLEALAHHMGWRT